MKKYLAKLKNNKYKIVASIFVIWMLFFDDYNLFFVYRSAKKLSETNKQEVELQSSIVELKEEIYKLNNNKEAIEKYVREYFLMKKDNEDLFIIVEE